MIKFKRILFPTDFSPSAQHALDYAISLALEYESSIILGHVIEDISFNSSFTLSSFPTSLESPDDIWRVCRGVAQIAPATVLAIPCPCHQRNGQLRRCLS